MGFLTSKDLQTILNFFLRTDLFNLGLRGDMDDLVLVDTFHVVPLRVSLLGLVIINAVLLDILGFRETLGSTLCPVFNLAIFWIRFLVLSPVVLGERKAEDTGIHLARGAPRKHLQAHHPQQRHP